MATAKCTDWKARRYEGEWADWYTDFNKAGSDGYCYSSGNTSKAYCFSFKTPAGSNFAKSSKIDFVIPVVRTSKNFATSGTLYFKLLTSDPTGGSITDNLKPSSTSCDASYKWSISDRQVHKVYFSISTSLLKPSTTYYVTVGGTKIIGIGYKEYTPADGWWSATLAYDTYTNGSKPTLSFTDTKDYHLTISGTLGRGDNNPLKAASLYYIVNDKNNINRQPAGDDGITQYVNLGTTAGATYSKTIDVPAGTVNVIAVVYCTFTYGPKIDFMGVPATTTGHTVFNIAYDSPGAPGKPNLEESSKKNGRLTNKQNWTFSWDSAVPGSTNAPIKGYWIRLWRWSKTYSKNNGWRVVCDPQWADPTKTSFTFNPVDYEFVAGDKVQCEVAAYSINAMDTKLWSASTGTYKYTQPDGKTTTLDLYTQSDIYEVENAGVVNVKVSGEWKEGQVYVKVNGEWKEAETVNVKVNGEWKESQ
jgi:hypothetical protein